MKDRRRIGRLNKKVVIQKQALIKDDYGDWVEGYEDWKPVWASIEPAGGREFWQSEKFNAEATGEIHIRYQPEVDPTMRVKYGDRLFEIQYPYHQNEGRQRTVLIVKEKLDKGVVQIEE